MTWGHRERALLAQSTWVALCVVGCADPRLDPGAETDWAAPAKSDDLGADPPRDAGPPPDAAISLDGSAPDTGGAGEATHDAAAPDAGGADAAAAPDAAPPVPDMAPGDPPVACAVAGAPGECIDVVDCAPPRRPTPGFCPGPAEIQCCHEVGEALECDAAAHPQPNAGLVEGPGDPGCPDGMAAVAGFCVDVYEGALFFDDGAPWSPYHNPGDRPLRAASIAGAVPQGYINGDQAAAACARAGKRLCTDAEWLRACQGDAGRTYPYGDERDPGVCNDARARHPAVELFPNDPNPFDRIQDACINQLHDGLTPTGDHPGCVTPEGVFDMMGNLHEWTADPSGTFRGGFYVDTVRNGPGCLYRTTAHNRQHWDYSTGFRCCADRR